MYVGVFRFMQVGLQRSVRVREWGESFSPGP